MPGCSALEWIGSRISVGLLTGLVVAGLLTALAVYLKRKKTEEVKPDYRAFFIEPSPRIPRPSGRGSGLSESVSFRWARFSRSPSVQGSSESPGWEQRTLP